MITNAKHEFNPREIQGYKLLFLHQNETINPKILTITDDVIGLHRRYEQIIASIEKQVDENN